MKKDKFKKNVTKSLKFLPPPYVVNLGDKEDKHDLWLFENFDDSKGLGTFKNKRTDQVISLNADCFYCYHEPNSECYDGTLELLGYIDITQDEPKFTRVAMIERNGSSTITQASLAIRVHELLDKINPKIKTQLIKEKKAYVMISDSNCNELYSLCQEQGFDQIITFKETAAIAMGGGLIGGYIDDLNRLAYKRGFFIAPGNLF